MWLSLILVVCVYHFVLQLKFIMEVEMCLLFIIDDATSELVCQVRSCDITYIGAGTWEGRGKGEGRGGYIS